MNLDYEGLMSHPHKYIQTPDVSRGGAKMVKSSLHLLWSELYQECKMLESAV